MTSMNEKLKPVDIFIRFKEMSLRTVGKLLFMLLEGRKKKKKEIERDLHGRKFVDWRVRTCTYRTAKWIFTSKTCTILLYESMP